MSVGYRHLLTAFFAVSLLIFLGQGVPAAFAQISIDAAAPENGDTGNSVTQLLDVTRAELSERRAELTALEERLAGADARIADIRSWLTTYTDVAGVASIGIDTLPLTELDDLLLDQQELLSEERAQIVDLDSRLSNLLQAAAQQGGEPADSAEPARSAESAGSETVAAGGVLESEEAEELRRVRKEIEKTERAIQQLRLGQSRKLTALATAERDLARRSVSQREDFIKRLSARIAEVREQATARSLDQARESQREVAFEPAVVRRLADEVVTLREEINGISARNGLVRESLQEASQRLERIRDDFVVTRERVSVVGPSPAVGRMLRRRLESLPSVTGYKRNSAVRRQEINLAIDRQIDLDDLILDLDDLDHELNLALQQEAADIPAAQFERVQGLTRDMMLKKRETLVELHAQLGALAASLTQLDQARLGLVNKASEYVVFIEGQLFTIPSDALLHTVGAARFNDALGGLFSVSFWRELSVDILKAVQTRLPLSVLLCLVAVAVLWSRKLAAKALENISSRVPKIRTDGMSLTLVALLCTLLLTGFWPLLMIGFGWQIQISATSISANAVGEGLMHSGLIVLVLGYVLQMCRSDGLAVRHFRWTEYTRKRLAINIRWFLPLFAISSGLSLFAFHAGGSEWHLISRILFIVAMASTILFFRRLLMGEQRNSEDLNELSRMADPLVGVNKRWFWFVAAVAAAIAIASYAGYHYTAIKLNAYINSTVVLMIGLLLMHNLLLRWSTLVQRRLRFQELLRKREEARQSEGEASETESERLAAEANDIDVTGLGEQTRRLIYVSLVFSALAGLYLIWENLFPALHILDRVQLPFSHSTVVDGIETEVPATLTDLLFGIMVLVATFIGARNLPGLLEFVLLQRLPIDAGARYATITIARYVIVAVGVIAGFSMIGADWSRLQWLVAALGVGLGFGLQEIVANFISGIILLFERPIRVGDTITLGDTDGTVTRIRIRATTIRNWDQRELVVPNKEFITGRLLNWTLSDAINRMVIAVGVAYGSDVDKALRIMMDIACNHPNVMKEPKPIVVFEGFGDSSLNLTLRCYLLGLDHLISAQSEINLEINRRFEEAGIVIPFPQQDVNFRALEPVHINLTKPASEA